jgi:hypothetical protein
MTRRRSPASPGEAGHDVPPGRVLLALARALFDERDFETVLIPMLADLQREVLDARSGRRRSIARLRGYLAFWRVVMTMPITMPMSSMSLVRAVLLGRSGGNLLIVLGVALLAAIAPVFGWFALLALAVGSLVAMTLRRWNDRHSATRGGGEPVLWVPAVVLIAAITPLFGWFVAAAIVSGLIAAILLRRWNTRHPSTLARSEPGVWHDPQINLSAIPVGGDFGGLMFVVGAFVIILMGLPEMRWFVASSVVIGVALAGGLFLWRSTHAGELPRVPSILN